MGKLHDRLFCIVFLVLICLPLIFFHYEEDRVSYVENKMSSKWPELSDYSLLSSDFTGAVEEYINDRVGFRDEMILLNISGMYTIFHDFDVTNFIEGKEKNTYYMDSGIIKCYQGTDLIDDGQMSEIVSSFEEIKNMLDDRSIEFIFFPIPNKEKIYPEYMPDDINVMSENSMLFSVMRQMRGMDEFKVVDVYTALENSKEKNGLLYYRNYDSSHWNMNGALVGCIELLDTISDGNKDMFRYSERNDWIVSKEEIHNAIFYLQRFEIMKKTFSDMADYMYQVMPQNGYVYVNDEQEEYYHAYNDELPDGKTVLIVGDSYIHAFMLPLLAENFKEVYFFPVQSTDEEIASVLSKENIDYFVYEVVERMTNYGELLSKEDKLKKIIKKSR